ncbi:MAG: hypothetical protein KGI57_04965, partial [Hyphomicrobiales bacterium]|nr:hypothetical protein [Hyphomicrobiales bacterium]
MTDLVALPLLPHDFAARPARRHAPPAAGPHHLLALVAAAAFAVDLGAALAASTAAAPAVATLRLGA